MDDIRGVPTSTERAANLEVFEKALRSMQCYRGDPVAILDGALAEDPDFVLGHIARAHAHVALWERSVVPAVEGMIGRLEELGNRANDRERRHAGALKRWAAGDWDGYRGDLERIAAIYPRDVLAVLFGHLADFFQGDRDSLRNRVGRVLPAWSRADPGYGFMLGMLAFGQEECGAYGVAEENGRRAIDLDPEDCWAQHAVAHVMEMQGRQAEGIAFMEGRKADWAQEDNAFSFHNWWHTALFNLDQGDAKRALEIYDAGVRPQKTEIRLMMVDAAAMLWRMHLQGIDVGNRWAELADAYGRGEEHGFYPFNDMHAMMAFVATGRTKDAQALLEGVEAGARAAGSGGAMQREVGLPIVRAIHAFGAGRHAEAVGLLLPVRYRAHVFGGSHAQRDIVHRTLIEAAIRGGDRAMARALTAERTALKPHCPFSWKLEQRAMAA